jgi:hypothetical protein
MVVAWMKNDEVEKKREKKGIKKTAYRRQMCR